MAVVAAMTIGRGEDARSSPLHTSVISQGLQIMDETYAPHILYFLVSVSVVVQLSNPQVQEL